MLVFLHASVASQVRVATKVLPQPKLVIVPRIEIVTVPQVLLAVGVSKVSAPAPHSLVLFAEQVMEGAVVSIVAMVRSEERVLAHGSVASQVRVSTKVLPHPRLVTVLRMVIV